MPTKLSEEEKQYLSAMPRWSNGISGVSIMTKIEQMENEYEFDVNIPIEDLREHVKRLEDKLTEIDKILRKEI